MVVQRSSKNAYTQQTEESNVYTNADCLKFIDFSLSRRTLCEKTKNNKTWTKHCDIAISRAEVTRIAKL